MSRRDTIIIALLINAALLAVLFMLAVNIDDDTAQPADKSSQLAMEKPQNAPIEVVNSSPMTEVSANNEVDVFLRELKTNDSPQNTFVDDEDLYGASQKDSSDQIMPQDQNQRTAPATAKADQGNIAYIEVKVKSGDVLEKIAKNNGTTVEAIKQANNLTSTKLNIGQVLKIPTQKTAANVAASASIPQKNTTSTLTPAPKSTDKKTLAITDVQYYTVKAGDSPWKIAKEMQMSVEDLLKLNGLDEGKARNLKVGEKIRVR